MHTARRFAYWLPALLWMALLFALSSRSFRDAPSGLSPFVHFGEYFILGLLLLFALTRTSGWRAGPIMLAAVVLAGLYGISDEWHQSFVPERFADPVDVLVDVVGAAGAAFVWFRIHAQAAVNGSR